MSQSEGVVQRKIWLSLGSVCCLFRLNTGRAWLSNLGPKGVVKLGNGSVMINSPRSIAVGFASPSGDAVAGACDLAGWTSVEITQSMVGRKVAVFTSIEAKASTGGRTSPEQLNWLARVLEAGGIAGVANSIEKAREIVEDWKGKML